MSGMKSKLQRIADQKVLADIQVDDSVMRQYGRNRISSLLADLEPFITWEWWLAGYRMYKSGTNGLSYGWFFGSDGCLACKLSLEQSLPGTFMFIWEPGLPSAGPRLYYVDSDDLDPVTVTSPHRNPPTKQAGAMVSLPEPDKRHLSVEMPQRLSVQL